MEITEVANHEPIGNIVEIDYEKHLDYLVQNHLKPTSVELVFQNPNSIRTFTIPEFHQNSNEITRRYGTIEKATYHVENELELDSIIGTARGVFKDGAVSMDPNDYFIAMEREELLSYGYELDDKVFLNHSDAEEAVDFRLIIYALNRDCDEIEIKTKDDFYEQIGADVVFCTNTEVKEFLRHLQNNKHTLFSEEELELIQDSLIGLGTENKIANLVLLDTILYKIEILLPQFEMSEIESSEQTLDYEQEEI